MQAPHGRESEIEGQVEWERTCPLTGPPGWPAISAQVSLLPGRWRDAKSFAAAEHLGH